MNTKETLGVMGLRGFWVFSTYKWEILANKPRFLM